MFKNHPRGLTVLFFTEMWERFGYYLMLGIFTLYMIDPSSSGGMGFSDFKAADIYGTYLALVYLTPFVGGLLADRILGYRKAIARFPPLIETNKNPIAMEIYLSLG